MRQSDNKQKWSLTFGRNIVAPQRRLVTLHCIEACRHQDHIWAKLLGDGHHHVPVHTHTHTFRNVFVFFNVKVESNDEGKQNKNEIRNSVHLKAVKYSTSPIGGSTPPVHAIFTLKPTPAPEPT